MLCNNCSKLAFNKASRKCVKCNSLINNNIYALCDNCSSTDKMCSVCLKRLNNPVTTKYFKGGCRSCGK